MSSTAAPTKTKTMSFAVRPMKASDIQQCADIEREAFPSLFPPTSFHRELKNRLASYLVASRRDDFVHNGWSPAGPTDLGERKLGRSLVGTLIGTAKSVWDGMGTGYQGDGDSVAGFLGAWYMVDEAHIVSIGVRRGYRGKGIGELLLICAIEQAAARKVSILTLEVRPSNLIARNLYRKYGFKERGVRKAYYADDREDAIIMSTEAIHVPSYRDAIRRLKEEHRLRWGHAERVLF